MASLEPHSHRTTIDQHTEVAVSVKQNVGGARAPWRFRYAFNRMSRQTSPRRGRLLAGALALATVLALAAGLTQSAQAQTYSVLYNFTGEADGAMPMAGLTSDGIAAFYGTANYGGVKGGPCGNNGCGVVYRLFQGKSGWTVTPLYTFLGGTDGQNPETANVAFGPDGALYSTTFLGGGACTSPGCGTVYKIAPVQGNWVETIIHSFNYSEGSGPVGAPVFDHNGNLDGATNAGGLNNGGIIYQLNQSNNWTEQVLFHPYGYPGSGVTMDHAGNLYGTTFNGGSNFHGSVYKLTPSGSGFIETDLYDFTNGSDGGYPKAGVILDLEGNIYGATTMGGSGKGGTVFKLSLQNGKWVYSTLYSFTSPSNGGLIAGPVGNLAIDNVGNLYGTTLSDGAHGFGAVFKLTPSNGSWTYTALHDFTNGSDGGFPYSNLVVDPHGDLYGTASTGGASGAGVVFEITP
jgi:uncharacterized repeat protein (TIGR03803 family)